MNRHSVPIDATTPCFEGEVNHALSIGVGDEKQLDDISNASRERASREKLKKEQEEHIAMGAAPPLTRVGSEDIARSRLREHQVLTSHSIEHNPIAAEVRALATLIQRLHDTLRADVDGLRADVETRIDGLGTEVAGLRAEVETRIDGLRGELETRFDGLRADVETRFDGLRAEVETRIDGLRGEVETRIDGLRADVETRFDGLGTEVETRFDGLGTEVETRFDGLGAEVAGLRAAVDNVASRRYNAQRMNDNSFAGTFMPIKSLKHDQVGEVFQGFPTTHAQLNSLTADKYNAIRTFYSGDGPDLPQGVADVQDAIRRWMV